MSPRAWWLGLVGLLAVALFPAVARADERSDAIAEELRRSGVYITDHAPREITPADAPRLRALLARVPGRVFLAVTPDVGVKGEPLLALLHDRLGTDGVYLVMEPSGLGLEGVAYGAGALPVKEARTAALYEVPYDAGPFGQLERYVEILTSGRAVERAAKARKAGDPLSNRDRRARQELRAATGGTAAGAALAMGLLHWQLRRRAARRAAQGAGGSLPDLRSLGRRR